MPPTIISGKDGKVVYGSSPTTLGVTSWSLKISGGILDVPNTTDGRRRIAGLPDAEGTIEIHVDTAGTMESDLTPGTILTVLKLYTNSTNFYSFTSAIIDSIDYKNEVEGTYDATINWKIASGVPDYAPGSS